eukprot:UN04856
MVKDPRKSIPFGEFPDFSKHSTNSRIRGLTENKFIKTVNELDLEEKHGIGDKRVVEFDTLKELFNGQIPDIPKGTIVNYENKYGIIEEVMVDEETDIEYARVIFGDGSRSDIDLKILKFALEKIKHRTEQRLKVEKGKQEAQHLP